MFRKSFALLAALCCFAGVAHAGDKPLYAPAPAWVKPVPVIDAAKLTDADPMVVLLDQQRRLGDGQVWAYADQAMRVSTTQAMSEFGQINLPWQPEAGDLIIHRAEILRGAERIDLLAKGQAFRVLQREEQLEQRQLRGTLTASMAIEGLRIGDVVRLTYSVTSKDRALQGNLQTELSLLADPVRAGFARARISWPADTPLKWRSYAENVNPKTVRSDGFDTLEVTLPLTKQPEMPTDAPARYQHPLILEAASFPDWTVVSKVMAQLYNAKGLIAPNSALAGEVAKIAAKSSDPRVRAALALRLVQDEIRYLYVGMNGGNYVPQSPADTWSLRYGDCKAKTLLLMAILDGLGIEAEAVAAHSTMGDFLPQRLPSAGAFDHVLVRAIVNGKPLWLDGTGSGSRIDDLDDVPPFRNVLPLRAAGAELLALPAQAPARPLVEIDLEIDQRAGLGLPTPYRLSVTMHGAMAEMINAVSKQGNKEQLSDFAETIASPLIGDSQISARSFSYDAERATATVRIDGIRANAWRRGEGRYRMVLDKTVVNADFAPDRARPAWQDIAVLTGAPNSSINRISVRLPDGGAGFGFEGDETLPSQLGGVSLKRIARIADGWIRVDDRVALSGADVPAKDIAATRAQITLAKTRLLTAIAPSGYPSRWQVVAQARKAGALAPVLAAYAAAIADDPKGYLGYQNRGQFYSGIWDWKNAIADFDRAIAIEPSANLYLQRASARSAMRDDAGALADAEAALKIDPGSYGAINRISENKARHGKLDEALAMLGERAAAGGKERQTFVSAQAQLLADAGRPQEGVALLDGLIASTPGNPDLLNSRCWIKGVGNFALDTGLKDCTKSIELSENPAAALDSRAMIYFRMGRMEDALADLEAALEIVPEMAASVYMRGVIRSRLHQAGAAEDLAAARMMSPRVDEDYSRYGIKP